MALYQCAAPTASATAAEVAEAASHLLGHYGYPGGIRGGSFTTSLLGTWEAADPSNRAALSRAFPAMGVAINVFEVPDGPEACRTLVEAYRNV